jgi:hypothetical protein
MKSDAVQTQSTQQKEFSQLTIVVWGEGGSRVQILDFALIYTFLNLESRGSGTFYRI